MAPFRARRGQGTHLPAVGCALFTALWLLPCAAAADAVAVEAVPEEVCEDDDTKWAAYDSTCADMKWMCNNEGYATLVRKSCPRTCGLCPPRDIVPAPVEKVPRAASPLDDAVVFIAERPTVLEVSSLTRVGERKNKTTGRIMRPSSHPTVSEETVLGLTPNDSLNGTLSENSSEVMQILPAPMKWEITLPFKEALVHVLSKAALVPHALWSPDQEYFVFEVGNGSLNSSDDGNVSTEAATDAVSKANLALTDEEDSRCPFGYTQVTGHVFGGDQFGKGYNLFAPSIHECARWCTYAAGCGSFDYSPGLKRCFRNSQTRPTSQLNRGGYVFCRRAPCPSLLTEPECLGPNISPGFHSAEVPLRPGSYCIWSAGRCSAPLACTYEDCFLPDGGLPGMNLPPSKTLWISRAGLMATMKQSTIYTSLR